MKITQNPKVLEAMRLLELIDQTNNAIERQKQRTVPDELALNQFYDLKQQYLGEFDDLMKVFGFGIDLRRVA